MGHPGRALNGAPSPRNRYPMLQSHPLRLATGLCLLTLFTGGACSPSVSILVTSEIGPAGGTVRGPNGSQAIVPAGALAQPTQLSIRTVPASAAPDLAKGLSYAGEVYSFEPHGLAFSAPVQIRLPAQGGGVNVAVVHAACAPSSMGAAFCKPWDAPLQGVTLEPGFEVFTTRGFSLYAPVTPSGDAGTGGAGTGGAGPTASSTSSSSGGPPACSATQADCNQLPADGCEVDLSTDPASCGSCGHSCLGGGCLDGRCLPRVVAAQQSGAGFVAVDASYAYWTALNAGNVLRSPLDGSSPPVILATGQDWPYAIALYAGSVFWTNFQGGSIMQVPADGSQSPQTIASSWGNCGSIAVDASGAHVSSWGHGSVLYIPPGGVATEIELGEGSTWLATDASHVYWVSIGNGTVRRANLDGSGATDLALNEDQPCGMTLYAGDVYWITRGNGELKKVPAAGGTPTLLATGLSAPNGLAVDATGIYLADDNGTRITRFPLAGGSPALLVGGQHTIGVTLDANAVYWADYNAGTVLALAK